MNNDKLSKLVEAWGFGNKRILIVYTSTIYRNTTWFAAAAAADSGKPPRVRRGVQEALWPCTGGPPCFEEAILSLSLFALSSRIPWGTQFSQAFGTQASIPVHARINCTESRTRSGSDRRFTFYTIRQRVVFWTSELLRLLPSGVTSVGFFWFLVFWVRNFERREVEVHFLWFLVFFMAVFQFRKL